MTPEVHRAVHMTFRPPTRGGRPPLVVWVRSRSRERSGSVGRREGWPWSPLARRPAAGPVTRPQGRTHARARAVRGVCSVGQGFADGVVRPHQPRPDARRDGLGEPSAPPDLSVRPRANPPFRLSALAERTAIGSEFVRSHKYAAAHRHIRLRKSQSGRDAAHLSQGGRAVARRRKEALPHPRRHPKATVTHRAFAHRQGHDRHHQHPALSCVQLSRRSQQSPRA